MDVDNLVKIIKSGADKDGTQMLDLYNFTINMLFHLTKGYKRTEDQDEDIKQEFFVWLSDAVNLFDADQGVKFTSFLWARLKGNLKTYYSENKTSVYCPRNNVAKLHSFEKERRRLSDILGREPSKQEICSFLKIKPQELRQIEKDLQAIGTVRSIDEPIGEEITLADAIADPKDFAEEVTEELARETAYKPLWRALSKESGLDEQIIKEMCSIEYRGKYDAMRPVLKRAIRSIRKAPAKYGALQKALEYQDVNCCRYKGVRAYQNSDCSVVEDVVFMKLERQGTMIEYATKKNYEQNSGTKKEGVCSICGKAGADRRILPSNKAIEYTVMGKRTASTTRGILLVCNSCLARETRTHYACEVLPDGSVVEFR